MASSFWQPQPYPHSYPLTRGNLALLGMAEVEFQEIGHCGGKVIFIVRTEDGRRQYQIRITHSAPTPAGFFGVYAIEQGVAVGHIEMGGIGTPWNKPPLPGCLPVFIATDSTGLYGHECPSCQQYWRSGAGAAFCPYCGIHAEHHQLLTRAQRRYVKQYCDRLLEALSSEQDGEHVIDMDAVADAAGKDAPKPPFYYAEQKQQNKFECAACGQVNDILGTYGYCSLCRTRNDLQELEGAIQRLRDRINSGGSYENCAKEAVATFDSFAGQYAKQLMQNVPMTRARQAKLERMLFHNLDAVADTFREFFGIEILSGLSDEDTQFARKMFHRRHVYEHRGGEADEKYIADSGDNSVRPKQALREDQASAHRIANVVLRLGGNLHRGFHDMFPAEEEVIARHAQRVSSRS